MTDIDKFVRSFDFNHDDLMRICQPLFNATPFDYFDYQIYYDTGNFYTLGSHVDFGITVYKQQLLPNIREFYNFHNLGLHHVVLSSQIPLPMLFETSFFEKLQTNIHYASEFKISNRIYHITRFEDHFRLCGFGSNADHASLLQYCLNSQNILSNFIHYFEHTADHVLHSTRNNGEVFLPYYNPDNIEKNSLQLNNEFNIKHSELQLSRTELVSKKFKELTKRELDCLELMAKGYTMKFIAIKLGLSHRTVESYVSNIKCKYNLNTKNQLVELFYSEITN